MTRSSPMVLLLVLLPILATLANAALFSPLSPVLQANHKNFRKEVLEIEKPAIVAFTAPWCGHCQRLVPEFDKAAKSLGGIIKFVNVDCEMEGNKADCQKYGVRGFPTILLFPSTKKRLPRTYQGERTAKAIGQYAVDSLPQSAKKLQAQDLAAFVNEDPSRPSVILFTTKPTSSPLLRSLALDFRTRVPFAFARGDEVLVRSHARMDLGLDIPTAADLPVLVIFPARIDGTDLEKGKFETYEGKLSYGPLKRWLDEVAPRYGAPEKGKAPAGAAAAAAAKARKNKASDEKKAQAAKLAEERKSKGRIHQANIMGNNKKKQQESVKLPEGAAYEWKATRGNKLPPVKDANGEVVTDEELEDMIRKAGGQMLNLDRAEELLAELNEADARRKAREDAEDAQQQQEAPSLVDQAAKLARDAVQSGSEAVQAVVDEGAKIVDAAAGLAGAASESASSWVDALTTDKEVEQEVEEDDEDGEAKPKKKEPVAAEPPKKQRESLADKLGAAGKLSGATGPHAAKRQALMKSFERWMTGEHNDWAEQYGSDFAKAQKEAEELLAKDPAEAERAAWESEGWLLEELRADREKMGGVMTNDQKAKVDEMIDLIEGRLAKRRSVGGRQDPPPAAAAAKGHDEL